MGLADEPGEYQPRPLPTARIFSAFLGEARRAQKIAFWSLGGRARTCSRRLSLSLSRLLAVLLVAAAFSASRSLLLWLEDPTPDDSRHVRRPGVETDAHGECLPEGGGGGRRLRACRDLCQARRDQCAGGPGPFPTTAGERRARDGAAPHTGTSSPGRTTNRLNRRLGQTCRSDAPCPGRC